MAIRAKLRTRTRWLDDAAIMVSNLPAAIETAGSLAFQNSKGDFLSGISKQPGPTGTPGRKIEWTSDLQRMAYFASNGFGGGIPSKRSGKLAAGWIVKQSFVNNVWAVDVENPYRSSRFVYGSLALANPKAAARFQQKFHAITGWQLAVLLVIEWYKLLQERFTVNMNIMIADLGTPRFKMRGITPRLPKYRRKI